MSEKRSYSQSARLMVRLSPDEKMQIKDAAWRNKKSISEFVRDTVLSEAQKSTQSA